LYYYNNYILFSKKKYQSTVVSKVKLMFLIDIHILSKKHHEI